MTRVIQPSFVFWVVVNPQSRLGGLQQLEHEKSKKRHESNLSSDVSSLDEPGRTFL